MMMGSSGRKLLTVWAFLYVCLLNGPSWQVAATTDPKDVTALQTLYNYWVIRPGHNLPPNWIGDDPCGGTTSPWAGVKCDDSQTHVLNLSMISYNLTGGLPTAIANLSRLQYLDLSFNPLMGGTIPPELAQLTSLNHLALAGCGLTGGLPGELGKLPNLEYIAVNQNGLTGTIPAAMGNLSKLTWFDISENKLVTPLPLATATSIGLDNLTSCKHFHFYNNSFSGNIPEELFNLRKLVHLLLSFNSFDGPIPGTTLANADNLTILSLDNNNLIGDLPPQLNQLTTLTELHLNGNGFTGQLPDLSALTKLQLLDVGFNSFDPQQFPNWTYSFKAAVTIAMPFSNVNGTLNSTIFGLPAIQTVDLSNNSLTETVDFENASSTLQTINLEYNEFNEVNGGLEFGENRNLTLRLFGNPLCSSNLYSGADVCRRRDLNAPFTWTYPGNPACTLSCRGTQTLNPDLCSCADPLVLHMTIIEPAFRSVNTSAVTFIRDEVADAFKALAVIADNRQVYIGSVRFSERGRMLFDVEFYPLSGNSLNRTEVTVIIGGFNGGQFVKLREGPYIMGIPTIPLFSSSSSKSKTSTGLIVGIAAAAAAVALIIAIIALYAIRQKRRADKAVVSRPFASWGTATNESGDAPELKGGRWFSLAELKTATNDFSQDKEIGAGGYGKVYKGVLPNGKFVAVKRADKSSVQGAVEFKNEIELLSRVHHKNLVGLVGFCYELDEQALVYEFVPNGTLREHLLGHYEKPLSWDMRVGIALGSAKGLTYLHELANPPIIHRDIKSGNILLDEMMTAKVADFGLSKLAPDGLGDRGHISTQVKGTLGYLDPEYYMTNQLSEKSDVYSFGVVLLEMLSARPPIERGKYIVREVRNALNKGGISALEPLLDPLLGDYPVKQLEAFLDLALLCVEEVSAGRPTMNEVVKKLEVIAGQSQPNSGVHITVEPQKDAGPYGKDYLQGIDDRSFQYSGSSFTASVPVQPK